MKIIHFQTPGGEWQHGALQADGTALRIDGDLFGAYTVTGETAEVARLRAPVLPHTIYGIGLNYRQHAEESGMKVPERPVVFMKPGSSVQDPGQPILIPTALASHEVDYECELAVVIGTTCCNVSRRDALKHVLGYTCANDVSARDWQIRYGGGQWTRGKSFNTFCPLGPCLVTTDDIPDPNALRLRSTVNGEVRQDSTTRDMIFDVPALIEYLSGSTTLVRGTVILTGTPAGVGMGRRPQLWLAPGDTVTVSVEGIGELTNPVLAEA